MTARPMTADDLTEWLRGEGFDVFIHVPTLHGREPVQVRLEAYSGYTWGEVCEAATVEKALGKAVWAVAEAKDCDGLGVG